jgi:hypothetical protein
VQVVRVGVLLTSENVTYNYTLQAALDSLNLAKILNLKTYVGENCSNFIGCKVDVDILL